MNTNCQIFLLDLPIDQIRIYRDSTDKIHGMVIRMNPRGDVSYTHPEKVIEVGKTEFDTDTRVIINFPVTNAGTDYEFFGFEN